MKTNLVNTYSLYITISIELFDFSARSMKRGEKMRIIILAILVTYYSNIMTMLKIINLIRKTGV